MRFIQITKKRPLALKEIGGIRERGTLTKYMQIPKWIITEHVTQQ